MTHAEMLKVTNGQSAAKKGGHNIEEILNKTFKVQRPSL